MGSKINLVLLTALAGGYVPWKMGIEFLDPLVVVPFALVSLMPVSAALPPRSLVRTGSLGMGYALLVLGLGVVLVNAGFWHGQLLLPPWPAVFAAALLAFSASFFAGAAALAMLGNNYTAAEAGRRIRLVLLVLLAAWLFRGTLVPTGLREAVAPVATTWGIAGMAVVVSLGLLLLGLRAAGAGPPEESALR